MNVSLISCCGLKLPAAAPARDLYQSSLFKKNLAYAEASSDRTYILSAKLGLIKLDQVIEPYDLTLNQVPAAARRTWSQDVASQLFKELGSSPANEINIQILAGRKYRDDLIPLIKHSFNIDVPLAGKGIGEQLSWLTKELSQ